MAHELAHTLQQRQPGGPDRDTSQREGEARNAARGVGGDGPMPRNRAASPPTSRDPLPGTEDDASLEATLAASKDNEVRFAPVHSRYIKIHARSLGACPVWHGGAGNPCWLFVDEIVVE